MVSAVSDGSGDSSFHDAFFKARKGFFASCAMRHEHVSIWFLMGSEPGLEYCWLAFRPVLGRFIPIPAPDAPKGIVPRLLSDGP